MPQLMVKSWSMRLGARPAFSLIEVLISIVVLALGLVGLAAVFPVVVQQQRSVSDTIQGISIERSAEDLVRGNSRLSVRGLPGTPDSLSIWRDLAQEEVGGSVWSNAGAWDSGTVIDDPAAAVRGLNVLSTTGDLIVVGNGVAVLPTRERLTPTPFAARNEPQFVWDIAARRVEIRALGNAGTARVATSDRVEGDRATDPIQVAVFVRRIDGSIRFGSRGAAWAFTRPPGNADARVPVAADLEGRPTLDGRGTPNANRYSTIQRIVAVLSADPEADTDALTVMVPDTGSELIDYARQVGQRFVSRSGSVHVVRSLRTDAAGRVTGLNIEPPVRPEALTTETVDFGTIEFLFTPQIPAAVSVFTIQQ